MGAVRSASTTANGSPPSSIDRRNRLASARAADVSQLAAEPKNVTLLADALYEVTGRKLGLAFAEGEGSPEDTAAAEDEPPGEDQILELVKETFDAHEPED